MTTQLRLALFTSAAVVLVLSACSLAEDVTPPPGSDLVAPEAALPPAAAVPERPPDARAGAAIYAEKCAPCHGASGTGDGPQAAALPNPPAALGDPAVGWAAVPDDWYAVVTTGNIDRFMPGFASLNDAERWDVVAHSLALSVDLDARASAGETYAATCGDCHGTSGEGSPVAPALSDPSRMAARSLEDLFTTISDGRGRGMPGYSGSITEDERWALAAYVRSLAFEPRDVAGVVPAIEPTQVITEPTPLTSTPPSETAGEVTPEFTPDSTPAESPTPAPTTGAVGVIRGQVVQTTGGGSAIAGMSLTLHGFDGQAEVVNATTRPDGEGRFAFEDLQVVPGRLFVVTTEIDGVLYGSDVAHLPEDGTLDDVLVLVSDATTDRSGLSVDRVHVLLNLSTEGILEVIELWLISNAGDRTIVSSDTGGVLEVALPEGALGLAFEDGTDPQRFAATESGFVDTGPVRPGMMSTQLVFSFALPYEGRLDFAQPVLDSVAAVVVLLPDVGLRLSGDGVVDQGVREVSGSNARSYALGPLQPGEAIAFRVSGRPQGSSASGNVVTSVAIGAAVLGISLIAAGLWWYRRPAPGAKAPAKGSPGPEGKEALLRQVAALDEAFEAGEIEADDHAERRQELKQRLAAILRDADD